MKTWTIQVQAQFTVEAETLEDACDMAVDQAMEMDPTDWGMVDLGAISAHSDYELLLEYGAEVDASARRRSTDPMGREAALRTEILRRMALSVTAGAR
jgi:hypothetical protein